MQDGIVGSYDQHTNFKLSKYNAYLGVPDAVESKNEKSL